MDKQNLLRDPDDSSRKWRIDGATFGVQYWAVPVFMLPMVPSRIDVFIPDQTKWPAELWKPLDARESTHMSDERVATLGISRHLAAALESWCKKNPDFEEEYKALPFGSSIKVPKITADISDMEFNLVPNHRIQECMLSVNALQNMWSFPEGHMPKTIDISHLRLERQLQKSITLVTLASDDKTPMIFKSRTRTLSGLYHEIKVLLTIPAHLNIIKKPLFLLRYHKAGALQEVLPQRRQDGSLAMRQQLKWARDVTKALIHVQYVPGQFYSDLKMDNIVLSSDGETETAILTDFEQSRNFYNWAPPEIYYVEWFAELGNVSVARSNAIDQSTKERFAQILKRYLSSKGQTSIRTQQFHYDNPPHGWYFPWLLSSPEEQEASEVYCLEKVLWSVESEQRFPEFRRTPEYLKELLQRCTAGAREWKDGPIGIFRRGGRVFPLGMTGANGEPEATLEETKKADRNFWQGEMEKAAKFILAKEKFDKGEADQTDLELLDYLRRPKLTEVLEKLGSLFSLALYDVHLSVSLTWSHICHFWYLI